MKNTITLLLFVLLTQWVGAQSTNTLDKEEFSIVYPTTYQLDESKSMGTTFILYSAADITKEEDFRENINLIMQEVNPAEMDLQAIIQSTEASIAKLLGNSKIISSSVKNNQNGEYYELVYSGDMGQLHLQWLQSLYYKNGTLYILTFTTEASSYAEFEKEGKEILNSFRIK